MIGCKVGVMFRHKALRVDDACRRSLVCIAYIDQASLQPLRSRRETIDVLFSAATESIWHDVRGIQQH